YPAGWSSPRTIRASSERCASCLRLTASTQCRRGGSGSRDQRRMEQGLARTRGTKGRGPGGARGVRALAAVAGLGGDAPGGEPGIYSARWAGAEKDFGSAMQKVDEALRARGAAAPSQRKAHFVSALCVAWPDGHLEEFEARVDGTLVWPPRGTAGFGYDPMFLPDGHARTFGEMSAEEKHGLPPRGLGLSHRARAFLMLAQACLAAPRWSSE